MRDVASLINSSGDIDTILHHLVYAACHHAHWSMGGVMSVDQHSGYAHVIARHNPDLLENALEDRWALTTSPALIALTRNQPVIIPDAQISEEFPGYRQEAIERGYRTVVVMPMNCRDLQGRVMVMSLQSMQVVNVTENELAFLETIMHLGAIAIDKAKRLRAEQAFAERLQSTLSAHSSLMQRVLSDGSVTSATSMIGKLLLNPIVVVDLTANLVVAERSPRTDLCDDAAWQAAVHGSLGRQFMRAARNAGTTRPGEITDLDLVIGSKPIRLSAMIEPLIVDGNTVGALFVFPRMADFSDLDHLLLDSAKFALSVQMMRSHIRFSSESRGLSDLFAEIFEARWRNAEDVTARARRLGIDLSEPARLIAIDATGADKESGIASLELHRSIARIAHQQDSGVGVAALDGMIVCRVPGEDAKAEEKTRVLMRKILEEARWILDEAPAVVMSKPFRGVEGHPAAWEECTRLVRLARRLNRHGALTSKDFGPFPVLLSAADTQEIRAFIESTIGQILAHDREHGTAYIETLTEFLNQGCRSQACADAMGLHVTTLRYRLSRIHDLFGVEMDTPERRFTLELAIRLNASLADGPGC
ncbi:helix-turn-helix domain-containing protein [Rhodoligotrophos defluvii]|uniref:helix-turn-helix domain-containing protein n=1 Tax=Rhodoligotrophos defluvii TaxID=2561934 RepID=UPI001EF0CA9A|nr:helix-turn-helix domain-containing protein [Rhodoligotrophos defluvii]